MPTTGIEPAVELAVVGPVRVGWAFGDDARRRVLRGLLAAAGAAEASPDDVAHGCPTCGSTSHGPLRASSGAVVLSLSHADGPTGLTVGAIASAEDAASVGVDVEPDRGDLPMAELGALFAPAEPPTIRRWTEIEAVAKADGRGLRIAPHGIRFSDEPGALLPGGVLAVVEGRARIEVAPSPAPAGYVVSVAIAPSRAVDPDRPIAPNRATDPGRAPDPARALGPARPIRPTPGSAR